MTKKLMILTILFGFSLFAFAGPVSDLIEKSGNSTDYPNSDILIIFDSTNVDVQESGLSYVNTHKLIKILTAQGAKKNNVIKYGYDPLSAYVEIQRVKIYRSNGTVQEIDPSLVMDYPAPARMIYWGAREKMIEIGRLESGDAIEVFLFKKGFTYALLQDEANDDERYIPPMRGHFYDIVPFWSNEPILEKTYKVTIPADKTVQYEFYNGEARSSMILKGDKKVFTFSKSNILPLKHEQGMVANSDIAPKLLMSTSPNWKAKSLWFYGVNEDFGSFESTPEIDKKVTEIVKDAKTEMDSISLLTHWVADEIRYSGISMGEGEGYTLHKGEMDFTDRCGVCKDKAGMLITMLRAAGFESYPAMTMAGSRIDYIPADQFNHSVTIVKLNNGRYKLLDPTWVPFLRELWSSAEQQQNYLMGIPEGADLRITPISAPENHYFKIRGNTEITTDGTIKGEIVLTAEGQSDASIRRMFTSGYRTEWNKNLEKELLKISPDAQITEMNYGNPIDYKSGPISITIKFIIPDYAVVTDEEIIFKPFVASNIFMRGMSHLYYNPNLKNRKYPFRDRCSRYVELKESLTIPANTKCTKNEVVNSFGNNTISYNSSFGQGGQTIKYFEKVKLGKRIYNADEWPLFSKVIKSQKDFAIEPIILIKNK